MSKIKNSGLDQYGDEAFKQQQFGTAGIEGLTFIINSCEFTGLHHIQNLGLLLHALIFTVTL